MDRVVRTLHRSTETGNQNGATIWECFILTLSTYKQDKPREHKLTFLNVLSLNDKVTKCPTFSFVHLRFSKCFHGDLNDGWVIVSLPVSVKRWNRPSGSAARKTCLQASCPQPCAVCDFLLCSGYSLRILGQN